jgi:hypothetical protein
VAVSDEVMRGDDDVVIFGFELEHADAHQRSFDEIEWLLHFLRDPLIDFGKLLVAIEV